MNNSIRPYKGSTPVIGNHVYIDASAVVIGEVQIGEHASIWPMAVVRGDVNSITIGDQTNIQDGAILHVTHDGPYTPGGQPLVIGKGVTIGHKAVLHACTIDNYCLIGIGAIILDNAHVENHVLIGAGSLVPPGKRLEAGHLYLGNPAKKIRPLTTKEIERLEYSANHYMNIKNSYLLISNDQY